MADVQDVKKKGDWYTVKGRSADGRPVSVDIPAPAVEGKTRKEAQALFERSIERMKEHGGT